MNKQFFILLLLALAAYGQQMIKKCTNSGATLPSLVFPEV
jgi:hypothetical protein